MRILSCHIENFGKLSDVNIDFNNNPFVILENNGWGKSTLAAFIRSMFYGLSGDGKRDDIQCERKRFAPWQGGAFGGSLIFETDGRRYLVTRFFKAKASDDEFELRDADTNLSSQDFSEHIGEELFSINSESFMRTVFFEQSDCSSSGATDDINAKIGNISDGTDINRFALAEGALHDYFNNMSATRKTGEIARMKADASGLKAEIRKGLGLDVTLSEVENRIESKKREIEEYKEKIRVLDAKKQEASVFERKLALRKIYEELKAEESAKRAALNERRILFPGEVPSKDVAKEWEDAGEEIVSARAVMEKTSLNETESSVYGSLLPVFSGNVPDDAEFEMLIRDASKLDSIKKEMLRYQLSGEEQSKLSVYRQRFDENDPCAEVVRASEKWAERGRKVTEANVVSHEIDEKEDVLASKKPLGRIFLVISLIFILGSAPLLYFAKFRLYGAAVLFAGLVLFTVSMVMGANYRRWKAVLCADIDMLIERVDLLDADIDAITYSVQCLLERNGLPFYEQTASGDIHSVLMDAFDYKNLIEKSKRVSELSDNPEADRLSRRIASFLSGYGMVCSEAEFLSVLTEMRAKALHFTSLEAKALEYNRTERRLTELRDNLRRSLLSYSIDPGMDEVSKVDDIADILAEYEALKALHSDAGARLDDFCSKNDVNMLVADTENAPEKSLSELIETGKTLDGKLEELRTELAADSRTFDGYVESYDEWLEQKEELRLLEENIEVKSRKLAMAQKAWEHLSKAKENLTARYMKPLLTGFSKYYGIITGESADEFKIDANTVLTKEEKGKQRSTELLSDGYRDLIGICMRIAMADEMYAGNKPFLILDDPFVNLDDRKMAGAKKLLSQVSGDYQVIYLTCRENRL